MESAVLLAPDRVRPRWRGWVIASVAAAVLLPGMSSGRSLEDLRRQGFVTIGTSGSGPPYTGVDSHNRLVGYDIDWGNQIGRDLGLQVRWVKTDFRGLIPALLAGQFDLVMSAVRIRDALTRVVSFSDPYSFEATVAVVAKNNHTVNSFADIRGHTVAVVAASFQEDVAKRYTAPADLQSLPGGSDVFLSLHTGHAEVAVVGMTAAIHYLHAGHDDIRIVGEGAGLTPQGIVIGKQSTELKTAIDRIIARRKADGTYAALYRKYFDTDPPQ